MCIICRVRIFMQIHVFEKIVKKNAILLENFFMCILDALCRYFFHTVQLCTLELFKNPQSNVV